MVFSSLVSALATHPATADPSSGDMFAAAFGGPPTSAPSSVMFNASAAAAAAAGPAVSGSEGFAIDVLPRFLADIARLNPFLLTTIWVGILALVTRTAWRLYYFVYDLIVSRLLTTTLTLTNEDAAFAPLTAYLSREGAFLSASKSSLKTTWNKSKKKQQERRADALRRALTKAEADLEARLPDIDFEPASGVHVFTFRGKLVWMTRQTATTPITTGWERSPFIFSSITLSAFGRSPDLFKDLIREAISESLERVDDETKVYTLGRQASYWSVAASRTTRNFDSVILPPGMAERVSRDVGEFLASEDWYNSRGIPFRRGILLAGVPGSGKTSLATALAGAHALDICVLTLSNKNLDDTTLAARLQDAPPRSIILLEDVDSVFVQRSAVSNAQAVTFSGLLNAIDGVAAQDGRVLLLSTNHPERLDPALIRPGRVDLHLHFGYAQTSQIRALFRRFYPGATAAEEQAFADLVPAGRLCMAALQGHFLSHKDDPEGAIADAGDLAQHYQGGSDEDNNAEAQAAALMRLGIRSMLRRLGLSQYIPNFVEQGVTSAAELTGLIANDLMGTFRLTTYAHRLRIQGALSSPPVATVVERAALVDADQAREIYDQWAALRASDHGDDEAGLLARRDAYVAALRIGTISGWQVFEHLDRVGDGGVEAAIATAAAAGDDYEKRECEMSAAEKAERDAAAKAAATADGDGEEEAEAEAEELDGSGVGN